MRHPPVRLSLAVVAWVAACHTAAPAFAAEQARLAVPENADVWFLGDSIFKGWGFATYDNPSPLCRVQDICNLLAKDNLDSPTAFVRMAHEAAGPPDRPDFFLKVAALHDIGPQDWVIYEDAGPHGSSYHGYRRKLALVADAVAAEDRRLFFMTMFDYQPPLAESEYDAPTKDEPAKSINDAIRDEAAARGLTVIDMNRAMDRLQQELQRTCGGSTCFPDGIHPNVFGNLLMALVIVKSLGGDVGEWRLQAVEPHFDHPAGGGDVPPLNAAPWGWPRDLDDTARKKLLYAIRRVAASEDFLIEDSRADQAGGE
ncbi:MAG: hypothetical protein ACKOEM_14445 [Planctomycetia bacterium]